MSARRATPAQLAVILRDKVEGQGEGAVYSTSDFLLLVADELDRLDQALPLLAELADDLEEHVDAEYPVTFCARYPRYATVRENLIAPVLKARALLRETNETKEAEG